ncbi:Hypothetical protein PHPALM_1132 [Phytophthora palmivora]|uniref:HAT C-terminal dimerisation domain-containing protein n=1 Tax=Phytophthora palmivora TaxID=4796 RepID=A0A2P4YT23_9STRA|nr:Hypothetical protein PHPALM_1132 [Phytophthora palmivora]
MALASRVRHATFTPAQVSGFYFRPCRDDHDEVIDEYFRCRCGTVRKQTRRNGCSNLIQHIRREHPDYEAVMLAASTAETGSVLNYVRQSALNVYGWMDWILKNNLPLSFCENRAARRLASFNNLIYTKLDPICVKTLVSAMDSLTRVVERSIATELPDRFGLLFDGWTHASEHFVAVFACYEIDGVRKTPLLSMAPLLEALDDDLSARGHMEFLAKMLPRDFGRQLSQCLFLVAASSSVNRLLATLMGVPLIGCASHRLNLAVQADMEEFGPDQDLVQSLMLKLRTISQSAKLRIKTGLRPVIRQDTRWGSTFAMHLDKNDDALEDFFPPAAATRRLRGLLKDLKKVESVAKALQCSEITMLDVRVWFDGLLLIKPQCERYIGPRAAIVHSPDFEAACVGVLGGQTSRLTRGKKAALQPFCSPIAEEQNSSNESSDGEERSFVEQLQKRRCLQAKEQRYELLSSIHPTSNVAERFFSTARITYGQERHGLQPITLEMILFLRQNCSCWDARTFDDATR